MINLDNPEKGVSSKNSSQIDKRYEKDKIKRNGALQLLAFTSTFILLFFVGLNLIVSMPYITIVTSMAGSLGISVIGYVISLSNHKNREKEILKLNNPAELGKAQYLKVPYVADAFLFISLIFAAIYVIAIYPFLPISITHIHSGELYEYYDYTSLFLDVGFYLIISFVMYHIFKKTSPKDIRNIRNLLFIIGVIVWFMLFVIFISIITVRSVSMPILLLTSVFVVGFLSTLNIAFPLIFIPIFMIVFSNLPDSTFLFVFMIWGGFLVAIRYTLEWGERTLRTILVKWAVLIMKARNTNEIKLERHEGLPQFSSGKIHTDDIEYLYLDDFLLDPLKKLGFVVEAKKKVKDILRTVVEGITVKIPEDSLKMWEEKLIASLEHYSFNVSQFHDIEDLSKKSGLKAEQVIAVLELSKNSSISTLLKSMRNEF